MRSRQPRTDGLLTRGQVAELLGRSKASVRRMEETGRLTAIVVGGAHVFDPKEVEAVKRSELAQATPAGDPASAGSTRLGSSGKVAAACFKLFEKGSDVAGVVQELELTPALVKALYKQWESGNVEPAPTPPVIDDREQEATEKMWRDEMDRIYSAWERELEAKWRPKRRPP